MLDFALRAIEDGHQVKWHLRKNGRNDNIGKGLVPRVSDWRDHMRWADLVILADNTKYLRELDAWRRNYGIPVVGATRDAAAWELDRTLGQQVFKKAGIDVPPFREFHSYQDAIAYVLKENKAFVSKPLGDEDDKSLSYVAKTPADLCYMLKRWSKMRPIKAGFILQEKVTGCEMAVGSFFGPHGFGDFCENFEFKALCHGGVGPNCGEMGTVLRFVDRSKLADKVLKPLEEHLHRIGYVGYVDVNTIIDDTGNAWPLEFTMRFGWPTFNIQMALLEGDCATWLGDLCDGRDSRPWRLNRVATGIVLALPEWPYEKTPIEKVTGVPIYGLTPANRRHFHPCNMMSGRAHADVDGTVVEVPMMVTAGDYPGVVTGTGNRVAGASKAAIRHLGQLSAPASPIYRLDIGDRLKTQLPAIQAKGYCRTLSY